MKDKVMTDKERILTHIFRYFYPKFILRMNNNNDLFAKSQPEFINIGDLVLAVTSGTHDFTIGYVIEKYNNHNMVVREVGSERTCDIGNEMFYKIDISELNPNIFLEGFHYIFYLRIEKAVNKYLEENYSPYYILMETKFNENVVTLYFREKWKEYSKENAPTVSFLFNKKTTIKSIVSELEKQLKNESNI